MDLKAAVARYLAAAGGFGRPMPLSHFHLPKHETEAMLEAWDEDYHLNRHFELISAPSQAADADRHIVKGTTYHQIVFKESVRQVLDHALD